MTVSFRCVNNGLNEMVAPAPWRDAALLCGNTTVVSISRGYGTSQAEDGVATAIHICRHL